MKESVSKKEILLTYCTMYFMVMMGIILFAESHISGGGGESDITVWRGEAGSIDSGNMCSIFLFLIVLMFPWVHAAFCMSKSKVYWVLFALHFIVGLLFIIAFVWHILPFAFMNVGPACDTWNGDGLYPSPYDKYTGMILLCLAGPILFVYGLIVVCVGAFTGKRNVAGYNELTNKELSHRPMKELSSEGAERLKPYRKYMTNDIPLELWYEIKEKQPELATKIEDFFKEPHPFYDVYAGIQPERGVIGSPDIVEEEKVGIFAHDPMDNRCGDSLIGWISFPVSPSIKSMIEEVIRCTGFFGYEYRRKAQS